LSDRARQTLVLRGGGRGKTGEVGIECQKLELLPPSEKWPRHDRKKGQNEKINDPGKDLGRKETDQPALKN